MNIFEEARLAGLAEAEKAEEKWLQDLLDTGWISACMKIICNDIKEGCKGASGGTCIIWRRFLDDGPWAHHFTQGSAKNLAQALLALYDEVQKMNAGSDTIKFEWNITPARVTTADSYLKIRWE